jgi:AAA-like domain
MKEFNITGKCIASQHYMADVSGKLAQVLNMIERGQYFIINRPRQYGKTTMLYSLASTLRADENYIVFNISFEGVGDATFEDEKTFSPIFLQLLNKQATHYAPDLVAFLSGKENEVNSLNSLSNVITEIVSRTDKKTILLIDEVDKSSNNQLFISFLAMLRNKYLERDESQTFHAIVLAGVHDVKTLKLKLRPDEEQKYNSPWNIAADFKIDMNLQPLEIKPMLEEYALDRGVSLDSQSIAERLFDFTSGYPFLVSKLCKIFDEDILTNKTEKIWTDKDIDVAIQSLLREHNTNFDTVVKNLENNSNLYDLIHKLLVLGEREEYNIYDPVINLGIIHGILRNGLGVRIHNKIYAELIYNYMTSKTKTRLTFADYNVSNSFYTPDKGLNMEIVLTRFQAFMKEQYSRHDRDFLERQGRLVFLAFIKPIINGSGYDFKETQISEERRLDVVITYNTYRYVTELKVWRGKVAHEEGFQQLTDYLNRLNLTEGYLIIFDHAKRKSWKKEWVTMDGKRVFMVWV